MLTLPSLCWNKAAKRDTVRSSNDVSRRPQNAAVDDADRTVARANAAGAKELMAVQDMFWGARYGKLVDPYGHEWGINQQASQLTEAEEADRARLYFSKK